MAFTIQEKLTFGKVVWLQEFLEAISDDNNWGNVFTWRKKEQDTNKTHKHFLVGKPMAHTNCKWIT